MRALIFVFLSIFCGCTSHLKRTDSDISSIRFGNGGGFTGKTQSYTINDKGELNMGDSVLAKIKKKELKHYFNQAELLMKYEYRKPDNLYYFIELKSISDSNYIVWGLGDTIVSAQVKDFYKELSSLKVSNRK